MNNDLFQGLMDTSILSQKCQKKQFWDSKTSGNKYSQLNTCTIPDKIAIINEQIRQLKLLQENNIRYENVEKFLEKLNKNTDNILNSVSTYVTQDIYGYVLSLMNSGLRGSSNNPYHLAKSSADEAGFYQDDILNTLKELLNKLNIDGSLSLDMINTLGQRLKVSENEFWNVQSWDYVIKKANEGEQLAAELIRQNSDLNAIVTGKWIDSAGKQLIEDVMAFSKSNYQENFSQGLTFYTRIDNNSAWIPQTAMNINELLNKSNSSIAIKLSNELYDKLRELSSFNTQVKTTGDKRLALLNQNVRNSLLWENYATTKELTLLTELYKEDLDTPWNWFKKPKEQYSEALIALTNFALSTNIQKTNLKANELYYTSKGFTTAATWIEQTGRYLVFKPPVSYLTSNFMKNKYRYVFNNLT